MQCEETILKINTDEDDSWVNEKVVIDFQVPKDIRYVMEECERLAKAEDVSYFNWAETLDYICKEAVIQKHMTKWQWERIGRRYPCG